MRGGREFRPERGTNEPVRDEALGSLRAAGHELDVAALPLHRGGLDDIRAGVVESHLVRLQQSTFPILGADVAAAGGGMTGKIQRPPEVRVSHTHLPPLCLAATLNMSVERKQLLARDPFGGSGGGRGRQSTGRELTATGCGHWAACTDRGARSSGSGIRPPCHWRCRPGESTAILLRRSRWSPRCRRAARPS